MDKRQILDVVCDFSFVLLMLVGSFMPPSGLGVTRIADLLSPFAEGPFVAGSQESPCHHKNLGFWTSGSRALLFFRGQGSRPSPVPRGIAK